MESSHIDTGPDRTTDVEFDSDLVRVTSVEDVSSEMTGFFNNARYYEKWIVAQLPGNLCSAEFGPKPRCFAPIKFFSSHETSCEEASSLD